MNVINGETVIRGCRSDRSLDVNIQDQYSESVDLYFCSSYISPTLSSALTIGDKVFDVVDATGITAQQSINITENDRFFQSIITDVTGTTITMASPVDYAFTTGSTLCVGDWNLAKDGSTTSIKAYISPPPNAKFDIYSINVNITDQSVMDSAQFGGITALTNGVLFRTEDGTIKNLPVVTNNIGFQEIGFTLQYDSKAPSGFYGMAAKKNYSITNGICFLLDGSTGDELQIWIQDDLTGLDLLSVTANGHVVKD